MTRDSLEVELKLLIDQSGHQSLLEKISQEGPVLQQTNHFFDTPDGQLRNHLWALRCREENEKLFLTAKGPSDRSQPGISSRVEIEAPTNQETLTRLQEGAHLGHIDHPAAQHLLENFGDFQVFPSLTFHNQRRCLPFKGALIELDHSTCLDQHRYEIEVEGSQEELIQWGPDLEKQLTAWGIVYEKGTDSKLRWATNLIKTQA